MSMESFGCFVPSEYERKKRNVIEEISTTACGNCVEIDNSEDNSIIFPIEDEWWTSECYCYGGFGKKTYTIQPHYCSYCDSVFWEYKVVEKLHIGTIIACILFSIFFITCVFMAVLWACATSEDKGLFAGLSFLSLWLAAANAFCLVTKNYNKDCGIESIIREHYYGQPLDDSVYFRSRFNIEKLSDSDRKRLEGMLCSAKTVASMPDLCFMPSAQHVYLGGKDYE